jgi:hypothetical protein
MLSKMDLLKNKLYSIRYNVVKIKSGQVFIGEYAFGVNEDIVIPELGLVYRKPGPEQLYIDGTRNVIFFEYDADNAAIVATKKKIAEIEAEQAKNRPGIFSFLNLQKKIFKKLYDMPDDVFMAQLDPASLYIPKVDPRRNWIEREKNTYQKMTTMPKDPLAGVQFKKLLPIIIIGVFVVAAVICLFVFFT